MSQKVHANSSLYETNRNSIVYGNFAIIFLIFQQTELDQL